MVPQVAKGESHLVLDGDCQFYRRIRLTLFHCSGFPLVSVTFLSPFPTLFSCFVLCCWGCYCAVENI
ncbi:hypothetical protein BDV30DRAFT_201912 [Aspergillus minisclerotigenes]|uniref:Uncharacterized protein n=1 Tax=Aspergillus minisclerotigenes TaxID=656917 RepID=A0A5N6JNY4_9EURO|nr:hypothetical protein BDV30DRAFT_201912 [Aspergillus minisclerotigenes]